MFRIILQNAAKPIRKSENIYAVFCGKSNVNPSYNFGLPRSVCSLPRGVGGKLLFQEFSILSCGRISNIYNNVQLFRMYHSSQIRLFGLEEFRDTIPRQQREIEPVGRSWSAAELRRKSYDDLHKLWYVLYKERNMLLTEQQLSRRKGLIFPQPDRILKVRKSMGAIKHVLGERKREHLFRFKAAREANIATDDNDESLPQSA